MAAKPLFLSGLLMLTFLAACSNNVFQEASATVTPTVQATPTFTPTITLTPTSTTIPTPTSSPTATLPPISLTFKPEADSFVDASRSSANYGTLKGLRVDGSPVVNSYLRFNVQGLGLRPISQVRLMIYTYSFSIQSIAVYSVADNTWGEKTITAENAPPLGAALTTSLISDAQTWITFDLTSYVNGEGPISFGLSTSGSESISLAARESITYSPQLIVDLH